MPKIEKEMAEAISIRCRERNGVEYFIEFESAVKLIVLERNSSDDKSYHVTQDMVNDYLLDGFTIKTFRAVYAINGEDFAFDEWGNMLNHFYVPMNKGYRTAPVKNYFLKPSKTYTKWFRIGKVKLMISFPLFWR